MNILQKLLISTQLSVRQLLDAQVIQSYVWMGMIEIESIASKEHVISNWELLPTKENLSRSCFFSHFSETDWFIRCLVR